MFQQYVMLPYFFLLLFLLLVLIGPCLDPIFFSVEPKEQTTKDEKKKTKQKKQRNFWPKKVPKKTLVKRKRKLPTCPEYFRIFQKCLEKQKKREKEGNKTEYGWHQDSAHASLIFGFAQDNSCFWVCWWYS